MSKLAVVPAIDVFSENHFWTVSIGDHDIALFKCNHMAEHLARQLSTARDRPQREAMHMLTKELGMCESFAKHVYSAFYGEASPTRH